MFRRNLFVTIIFLLVAVPNVFAQSNQITNGLTYLSSTQKTDGTWGDDLDSADVLQTTVAAIESLQYLNQTNTTVYTSGVAWLQSLDMETTDYASERIRTVATNGTDLAKLLEYLNGDENAWGGYDDYRSNNLLIRSEKAHGHSL